MSWCEISTRASLFRHAATTAAAAAAATTKQSVPKKLRVLCIHGYGQHSQGFRQKSGALRRAGKKYVAEWDFVEAKLDAPIREELNELDSGGKAWWLWNRSTENPINTGWEESIDQLVQRLEENGPYDGCIGFSQGASMLSLLISEQQSRGTQWFRFACFIGGFVPRMPAMRQRVLSLEHDTNMCTWHSYGLADEIIRPSQSIELILVFGDKAVVCPPHQGGHLVSSTKEVRTDFKHFIASVYEDGKR